MGYGVVLFLPIRRASHSGFGLFVTFYISFVFVLQYLLVKKMFFFLKDYLLFIPERQRQGEIEAEAEGEAHFPRSREPDVGLELQTLRP